MRYRDKSRFLIIIQLDHNNYDTGTSVWYFLMISRNDDLINSMNIKISFERNENHWKIMIIIGIYCGVAFNSIILIALVVD